MKASHYTTPRTLADCSWTEGHPQALTGRDRHGNTRSDRWAQRVVYALFIGFAAWCVGLPLLVNLLGRL